MLRRIRRKIYYKIRFQTWFRKANYYHRKRGKITDYIVKFRGEDELRDRKYVRFLKRDMIRCLMKYGSYYDEFFLFDFEDKDEEYRSESFEVTGNLTVYSASGKTWPAKELHPDQRVIRHYEDLSGFRQAKKDCMSLVNKDMGVK